MKNYYLLLILSLLLNGVYAQDSKKDYTEAFQVVEVWLEAQKDYDQLPGLTAIVVEDQEVLWSGAVGMSNIENKTSASENTICSICSISKLFTSVAIMKLYDEGKIRLDDKVSDHLPAYALEQKYPESGPITIRSLLTHSSGIPREAGYPYWTGPDFPFPTKEEIDSKLKDQETLYPASTYFQYSNLGLTLLGEIVEEISGMPYDDYVEQNILTPLGLSNTRTELPENLYGEELAIGYTARNRDGSRNKVKLFQANGITPAAGFSSTVGDLGKFASWQFRLRDSTLVEILKPATLKNMQNVHWTNPDWSTTWGLGFSVYKGSDGNTWVGHGGSCPGYRSTLQINLKTKRAFSVMINANGTNPNKYGKGINAIMNKMETSKKDMDTEASQKLKNYVGYYDSSPWWGEVYIGTFNGKLVSLSLPSEEPAEAMHFYKHIEGDVFRRIRKDKTLGETLTFIRDKDGKIVKLERHGNFSPRINR
ncbi:serine hydrolase [Lutimonas halocynthiae]|uniref:serine hydrolase n=1 Tax=Lutimonas halocynthiae TaxID=1446477 RepID=UPI0025B3ED32|nr:serine hydrolase [Lutimonas halocynthiae]MDN3644496.1 serine hydrolase [Lutimonas halocynthiae]